MRIDVFTIFPDQIVDYSSTSILGRGVESGLLRINAHDIRDGSTDRNRRVDDSPYGGGAGMLMSCEPIFNIVERVVPPRPLILMSPSGDRYDQTKAAELAALDGFSILCGRYEGVDQRVVENLIDDEISLGDFVLAGGELAALAVIESVARLVPGVLGNDSSIIDESFSDNLLEYPQYTRPETFRGWTVPEVLLSGNHARIEDWRAEQSTVRTKQRRPDLAAKKFAGGSQRG